MKSMKLFSRVLIGTCVVFLASAFAYSEEQWILQFVDSYTDGAFVAGDEEFYYSSYLIVQEYGNEGQRLPFSKLSSNDWIQVTFEFDSGEGIKTATKVEILPSESFAENLKSIDLLPQ